MVTYSSEFVEQIVIERDLLNHKLKQQQSDLRKLVEEMGAEIDTAESAGAAEIAITIAYWRTKVKKLLGGE